MTALLILGCSEDKREVSTPTPFLQVYDGPIWQQLRKHNYPADKIAAISARYGLLEPGDHIESYSQRMDEDRLLQLINDPVQIAKLVTLIEQHGGAIVFGGEFYKLLVLALTSFAPHLLGCVYFVSGSYLKQRKGLNKVLTLPPQIG